MKICIATTSFPRWANDMRGIFVFEAARFLVERGVSVRVVAMHNPEAKTREMMGAIEVIHLAARGNHPCVRWSAQRPHRRGGAASLTRVRVGLSTGCDLRLPFLGRPVTLSACLRFRALYPSLRLE